MKKKKRKQVSKMKRTSKKPISITTLIYEKVICHDQVQKKENGVNPFTLY